MYIKENGKIFIPKKMKYLGSGSCGDVYTDGKKILKKYLSDVDGDFKLDIDTYRCLSMLKNSHLMEIQEIFTSLKNHYLYSMNKIMFQIDAYLATYYESDDINILLMDKDYLLENLYEIEKLILELSHEYIVINDIKMENTIFQKEKMIIIDPDCFKKMSFFYDNQVIIDENKAVFGLYFIDLIYEFMELLSKEEKSLKLEKGKVFNYLCNWIEYIGFPKMLTDEIFLLLKNDSKPIDLCRRIIQ